MCDPRVIESARIADVYLPLRNGSNLALVNALAYTVIDEDLADWDFIDGHTEGFDAWWDVVQDYAPEDVEGVTGLDAERVRHAARRYAQARSAVLGWGMGVTQQAQGVQTVRALAALALVTGHIGRPNSGLAPVRGQNNVQGSCDMGMWPSLYPGYQRVDDPAVRAKFAAAWGVPEERLSLKEGYKLTDLPHAVAGGRIRAFYNFGEDPLQTEPDTAQMRRTLESLDLLISQDIFIDADHGAGRRGAARHLVGRARRRVHRLRPHVPAHDGRLDAEGRMSPRLADLRRPVRPPGLSHALRGHARNMGRGARAVPPVRRRHLRQDGRVGYAQWPIFADAADDPKNHGTPELYAGGAFTTPDGKAHLAAAEWRAPTEQPEKRYPLVLCTVREVGHYSCRSMTGNCKALAALADEPGYVSMSPADADARGIQEEELVWVYSRRGKVLARAAVDERVNDGAVYMTYQWWIGKCNALTLHATDGESGTPEDKYSACEVEAIADQAWAERHLLERYVALKEHLAKEAAAQDAVDAEGAADAGAVVVAAGAEGCDGLGSSEVAGVGVGSVAGSSLCGGKAEAGS